MGSTGRLKFWHHGLLLVPLLILIVGFSPGTALAADEDGAPPSVDTTAAGQPSGAEDATPPEENSAEVSADPEGLAPAPDEPTSEEVSPTEAPLSTDPTDVAEEAAPASGEPVTAEPTEPSDPAVSASAADPDKGVVGQPLPAEPKVTICHRTNDRTNPYNEITVTIPKANGHAAQHEGPIFTPDGPRPWGDIIPPIPDLPGGQNWPEGQVILNDGCEVEPDSGPLPDAVIGEAECAGVVPSLEVTVSNDPDATAPAFFTILVDGDLVQTVGPIAPGDSQTVTITGTALLARENQTFTVDVRSGGEVIASEVISVDCDPPPPPGVEITTDLLCGDDGAEGNLTVTNNGPDPVTVTATANGEPLGQPLIVGAGATETGSTALSQFEDQTVTIEVFVDGELVATYTPTPDCELTAVPGVKIAGLECAPPSATVTLSNDGDAESTVVFTILVNGKVVQESAPLFGGDTTTIVADLTPYEDQTVTVEVRANDDVLGSRTITVNCSEPAGGEVKPASDSGPDGTQGAQPRPTATQVLPATGAGISPRLVAGGLGMIALGVLLILAASRTRHDRGAA